MHTPENLFYTKDHEWALESNGEILIGITDFAQNQLGDIVYVELPQVGNTLQKGNSFGVVESVKAVSDLYSPVSGKVIAVNDPLKEAPHLVNSDPYQKGWMIRVKPSHPEELSQLLTTKAYRALCEEKGS